MIYVFWCHCSNLITWNRQFDSWSKHNIKLLVQVGLNKFREIKEHWAIEGTTILVEHTKLSVIVLDKSHFNLHWILDHISVSSCCSWYKLLPMVWFLWDLVDVVVVPGEWIECTYWVPPSAQFSICITDETANVGTSKWNTYHVMRHDTSDRECQVLVRREIIS